MRDIEAVLAEVAAWGLSAGQILRVYNEGPGVSGAILYAAQKTGRGWEAAFEPIEAVIGKAGFAAPGEKVEGDGKTPSGLFPLSTAFGSDPAIDSRLPYRQALEDDVWVDDPKAPDYNTWTKRGLTKAASFERMRREDGLYRVAIVIEYNTRPVAAGKGSAIFVHLWRGLSSGTEGCVAMAEADLRRLLSWLDPAKNPSVLLGPSVKAP